MGPPDLVCHYCQATGYGPSGDLLRSGWRRQILKDRLAKGKRVAVCSDCWSKPEVRSKGAEEVLPN